MNTLTVQSDDSDFSSRVNAIIVALRADRSRHMHLNFIREGNKYVYIYVYICVYVYINIFIYFLVIYLCIYIFIFFTYLYI
jgi:hypothetical protein